jgi:hypothetical protein
MTAAPDPMDALLTFLLTDTDLAADVGELVFGSKLPPEIVGGMPQRCILLLLAGGSGDDDGYLRFGRIRFDVRTYGDTDAAARILHLLAHRVLKNLNRRVSAGVLLHAATRVGGPIADREPNTDWPFVLSTYQLGYGEAVVP